MQDIVIVIDFGAQYSQLIARRVRECKVYCEIMPWNAPLEKILEKKPTGIIFSGGPNSVYEEGAPTIDSGIFEAGIPILGICYGHQLMAYKLGGKVDPGIRKEFGKTDLVLKENAGLFAGMEGNITVWMSHGDYVSKLPEGFELAATSENGVMAAMFDPKRKFYGLQFHPEVVHTPRGTEILKKFLYDVCGCKATWTMGSFIEDQIQKIRETVGDKPVICGMSGGVDSSTAALLVHKAIGKQLTCIFVDHGLLRKNEAEKVKKTFKENLGLNLVFVDASERFLTKLKGVTDPEKKRKIIGEEFIRVFEEESKKIGKVDFLVQGTLYPDVIESGTSTAATIKSHHNVGGLPEDMDLKTLEPFRLLFKDEVREVAKELGLPDEIVWRHPFPGPGLAIRIIGEITRERLQILRDADSIIIEEIRKAGLYRDIWQLFAVLLPIRSVGVMGDMRTYSYPIVLRAVTGQDAMTCDWARIPYDVLEKISNRVVNEVPGVNRLVYDITSKPPATIEWE